MRHLARPPAVREAAAEAQVGEKRRREEAEGQEAPACERLWEQLDGLYAAFAPFRDASIDRWHRKTTLTTGGAQRRRSVSIPIREHSLLLAFSSSVQRECTCSRWGGGSGAALCPPAHVAAAMASSQPALHGWAP